MPLAPGLFSTMKDAPFKLQAQALGKDAGDDILAAAGLEADQQPDRADRARPLPEAIDVRVSEENDNNYPGDRRHRVPP